MCLRVEGKKPVARQGPKLQEGGGDKLIGQNLREFGGVRGDTFIWRNESGEGRRTPPFQSESRRKEGLFEEIEVGGRQVS